YDVYLSANQEYVRAMAQSGRLDAATVRVYAVGRVGLWSRGHQVKELKELASDAVVHVSMPNPAHAPYGVAAREALEEAGLWTKVESKVVYGENVRQALQYAESGNAEVTLTAWSLIHDRGGVLLPAELYTPVLQAGAAVRGSKRAEVARRFLEFLTGPDGQRILRSGGFGPPPTP
ncbi:MAG TPA: molybdate ABC transporter substrate-binding protein, partial [Bryobacteraceae bacterium]|nr:molybdate ABC transporter substrate-binding protein [Bryobacteraceae bacterium]